MHKIKLATLAKVNVSPKIVNGSILSTLLNSSS